MKKYLLIFILTLCLVFTYSCFGDGGDDITDGANNGGTTDGDSNEKTVILVEPNPRMVRTPKEVITLKQAETPTEKIQN